ncbi:MAG: LbtU family siderophore porin [Chromatiales bacterium]|nr:LbtU family siderophore porin [Chromatiales bacterium]
MSNRKLLLLAAIAASTQTPAQEANTLYSTREERREAGLAREIVEGLSITTLLETEAVQRRQRHREGNGEGREDDANATLQLALLAEPLDWLSAEVIYEFEVDGSRHTIDEALVKLSVDDVEIEAGLLYLPFGEYFSHFITGPILEFGETRDPAVILAIGLSEEMELSVFGYRGEARQADRISAELDYGLALEWTPRDALLFGLSYVSDLADSDEELLEDEDHRYEKRVGGLAGYMLWQGEGFQMSAEFVSALGRFRELDREFDRPVAWNLELAYRLHNDLELSARLEGSDEIEDAPYLQAGLSLGWLIADTLALRLEYLHGRYRRGLAEDDRERELERVQSLGFQLSWGI